MLSSTSRNGGYPYGTPRSSARVELSVSSDSWHLSLTRLSLFGLPTFARREHFQSLLDIAKLMLERFGYILQVRTLRRRRGGREMCRSSPQTRVEPAGLASGSDSMPPSATTSTPALAAPAAPLSKTTPKGIRITSDSVSTTETRCAPRHGAAPHWSSTVSSWHFTFLPLFLMDKTRLVPLRRFSPVPVGSSRRRLCTKPQRQLPDRRAKVPRPSALTHRPQKRGAVCDLDA